MGVLWNRRHTVGDQREWQYFKKTHRDFVRVVPELDALVKRFFTEQPSATTDNRRLVFMLGCLCWQDFKEIILLCANGYGIAAARALRSLYEHAVTAQHIARHPENAHLFNEYIHVQDGKILQHAERTLTPETLARWFTDDQKRQVREESERVRALYKKGQSSWSPINLLDMAFQDGDGLEAFYSVCYAHPSSHVHATARGLYSRISQEGGRVVFQAGPQRQEASDVLGLATVVFLLSLRTQAHTFSPMTEHELMALAKDILSRTQ
jgi:hypothetical protein